MRPYHPFAFPAVLLMVLVLCLGGLSPARGHEPAGATVSEGAVTIEPRPQYFFVTLDFTKGRSHRQVGKDYGRAILRVYPDFEGDVGAYLFQAATVLLLWGNTLTERVADIRPSLDPEYRDEIDGLASSLKGSATFSGADLAYVYNLLPDVLRATQCSGFGVWGSQSALGTNIAYRTLDWYGLLTQPFPRVQAVTRLVYPDGSLYLVGGLGHLGVISAINPRTRIMAAILDASVEDEAYRSAGRRSYPFDLRHALERAGGLEEIAAYLAAPARDYAIGHLIMLADPRRTSVLENNTARAGTAPRRALRTDTSELNPGVPWGRTEMLGIVNAFMLKGQRDNFATGLGARVNQRRWALMRDRIASHTGPLSIQDVKGIMTAYWGSEPGTLYSPLSSGDLYNSDTQQMLLYVPASNHLEVFFRPKDGAIPNMPEFIEVKLD